MTLTKKQKREIDKKVAAFKDKMKCKLWDSCRTKDCLQEAMQYGGCIWSKEVCYALKDLEKQGLIEVIKVQRKKR